MSDVCSMKTCVPLFAIKTAAPPCTPVLLLLNLCGIAQQTVEPTEGNSPSRAGDGAVVRFCLNDVTKHTSRVMLWLGALTESTQSCQQASLSVYVWMLWHV